MEHPATTTKRVMAAKISINRGNFTIIDAIRFDFFFFTFISFVRMNVEGNKNASELVPMLLMIPHSHSKSLNFPAFNFPFDFTSLTP
jgi:hypothetical protein